MFKNNLTLQQVYSVKVKNKFDFLKKLDVLSPKSIKFIEANNYAAQKMLPTVAKKTSNRASCDQSVVNARQKTKAAFNLYCVNTNEYNRLGYEHAKRKLEKAYNMVTEKDLSKNTEIIKSQI